MTRTRSISSEAELAFFEERFGPDPDAAAWTALAAMESRLVRIASQGVRDKLQGKVERARGAIEAAHAARWANFGAAPFLTECKATDAEWRKAKAAWHARTLRERKRAEIARLSAEIAAAPSIEGLFRTPEGRALWARGMALREWKAAEHH